MHGNYAHRSLVFALVALVACHDNGSADHVTTPSISIAPEPGQDDLPVLESPFTPAETTALRAGFDWNATSALPEVDEDGNPALYYMLALVDTRETYELLALSGTYFDAMPLFPQELERWNGQQGYLQFEPDDAGVFVFTFLSGVAFNRLRELGIAGNAAVPVIIPRAVPVAEAQLPSGALSYRYLVDRGFTGISPNDAVSSTEVGASTAPLHAKLRFFRRIINLLRDSVNAIRTGIAAVRVALGRDRNIKFRFRVYNLEVGFFFDETNPNDVGPFVADDRNLMVRAWGPAEQRGQMLVPEGAPIMYMDNLGLVSQNLDASGFVSMTTPESVRDSNDIRIYLRLTTNAAAFLHGPLEDRVQIFSGVPGSGDRDLTLDLNTLSARVQMLTQMTDTWKYGRDVLGFAPSQAAVRDSGEDSSGFATSSATLCLTKLPLLEPITTLVSALASDDSAVLAFIAWPFEYPLDIVMVTGTKSRLTATHEYGHYVWCSMMSEVPGRFLLVGPQALRLTPGAKSSRPGNLLAEAWADLIAAQVAGGVDYFNLDDDAADVHGGDGTYCDGAGLVANQTPCVDDNIGGPAGGFPQGQAVTDAFLVRDSGGEEDAIINIGQSMTTMQDFFDGQASHAAGLPDNGTSWWVWAVRDVTSSGGPSKDPRIGWFGPPPDAIGLDVSDRAEADELVAIPGSALRSTIREWWLGDIAFRQKQFIGAMAQTAIAEGASTTEVCRLISNHTSGLDCESMVGPLAELDDVERAPLENVSVVISQPTRNDAPVWDGSWFDPSVIGADTYEVSVVDSIDSSALATDSIPWVRDLRTAPFVSTKPLPFDRDVTLSARAAAGTAPGGFGPSASIGLTTPAEPVGTVTVVPTAGGANLSWTATQASSYEIRVFITATGATRVVARTTSSMFSLIGLSGGIDHRVEVFAVNRAGTPSEFGSTPVTFAPLTPVAAFVSHTYGDDSSPLRGSAAIPYKTVALAVSELGARGFDVLRIETGTYDETSSMAITNDSLSLEGGYTWNGSAWVRTGGATVVNVPMADTVGPAYRTTRFLAAGPRSVLAGLALRSGAVVSIDGVDIVGHSGANGASECGAAVGVLDSQLALVGARVATDAAVASGCRFGIHATGLATISTTGSSRVVAFAATGAVPSALSAAGVATVGPVTLSVPGSTVVGISTPSSATFTTAASIGLGQDALTTTVLSRLTAFSVDAPRLTTVNGTQLAIDLIAAQSVRIDNSYARTSRSSASAIRIEGSSVATTPLNTLGLYYNTVASGDDWLRTGAVASSATSLVLVGHTRTVTAKNNLFVVGERLGHATIDVSVMNPTNVSGASFAFRGNALAIASRDTVGTCWGPGLVSHDVEYWVFRTPPICDEFGFSGAGGQDAASVPNVLSFGVTDIGGNIFLDGAVGVGPEVEARAPFVSPVGRVLSVNSFGTPVAGPTGTYTRLDDGGVVPAGDPPTIGTDLAGLDRSSSGGQADVGAFVY